MTPLDIADAAQRSQGKAELHLAFLALFFRDFRCPADLYGAFQPTARLRRRKRPVDLSAQHHQFTGGC